MAHAHICYSIEDIELTILALKLISMSHTESNQCLGMSDFCGEDGVESEYVHFIDISRFYHDFSHQADSDAMTKNIHSRCNEPSTKYEIKIGYLCSEEKCK